jgi:hypothetical protein
MRASACSSNDIQKCKQGSLIVDIVNTKTLELDGKAPVKKINVMLKACNKAIKTIVASIMAKLPPIAVRGVTMPYNP